MAFNLPDGSKLYIATGYGSAITTTALTNADPAVASATGHGLTDTTEIVVESGWEDINENVYRVDDAAANTFELEGLDTSDTDQYTAGAGVGSVMAITAWTEITQVINIVMQGGEPQFADVDLLARKNAIRIPTRFAPSSMEVTLADDPTLAGYIAAVAASRSRAKRAFKLSLPGGAKSYGYGYIAVNEMPTLTKGQVDTIRASISLLNRLTRYAS